MKMQTLTMDSLIGPQPIAAPADWTFDKTATIAWASMLHLTRSREKPHDTKRAIMLIDAQIEALGTLLSSAVGMAMPYWTRQAKEYAYAAALL